MGNISFIIKQKQKCCAVYKESPFLQFSFSHLLWKSNFEGKYTFASIVKIGLKIHI